ncbi:nicotinate-nucleotide adenylyltransferase [bacterium]|nr:nicotinate-nucleotide adenylyltransferase [bacterium]
MRIGLFGGTFDPVHTGHMIIASLLCSDLPLDLLIFIPTAFPPHKRESRLLDPEHRIEMLKRAINGKPEFKWSEIENRNEVCYTIDTVRQFRRKYPDASLYLIIGADSLADLHTWMHPDQLLQEINIVVVSRPGIDLKAIRTDFINRVTIHDTPVIGISSSMIRQRIRDHKSIATLVPEPVEQYILQHGLYR